MANKLNQVVSEEVVTAIYGEVTNGVLNTNCKVENGVLHTKCIQKEDLDLSIRTIFNGGYQEVEEDKFTDDKTLLFANISVIDIDTTFTNGNPFVYYDKEYDEYRLDFGGDEAPKIIDLEEDMTLCKVIELTKEKLIEYQLEYIDGFFEMLESEKDEYDEDEWFEGVRIKVRGCGNEFYYINELLGDLPQVLEDKIQDYLLKFNINNIEFKNGFIYVNQ